MYIFEIGRASNAELSLEKKKSHRQNPKSHGENIVAYTFSSVETLQRSRRCSVTIIPLSWISFPCREQTPIFWLTSILLVSIDTCDGVRYYFSYFILHGTFLFERWKKMQGFFPFPIPSHSCLYHKNMYIFVASEIIVAHRRMCIECLVLSKNTTAGYWFIFFFLLFQNIVCWCISLFVSSSVYLEVKKGRKNICAKLVVFQRFQHGNF